MVQPRVQPPTQAPLQKQRPGPSALRDFFLDVSRGLIPGVSEVHVSGENDEIDSGVTADLWDGGITVASGGASLLWVPPTAARIHQIVSSSANDDVGQSGVTEIHVEGLDSNFNLISELVTMNGTTNVATVNSYIMIYDLHATKPDSDTVTNVGIIKATADTDSTVTIRMNVGNNHSQHGIYQIPANHTAYMFDFTGHILRAGGTGALADIVLLHRPFGELWQKIEGTGVESAGSSDFEETFMPPLPFKEKEWIKMQATSGTNNAAISGGFDLVLVRD